MGFWGEKSRGQSELIGTVFMISLTIFGAVLTVALAGGALQAIGDEAQDSLTRDAFHEMDSRLSGLRGSQVSSETTLRFPQGSGSDLSANESEGSVNITVETADGFRNLTEKNVTHVERSLGTVVYEGRNGQKLVYQGGGLWEFPSRSHAVLLSNPPLSRAGQFLTFEFANLNDTTSIDEGEEIIARRDVAESEQFSEDIRTKLSPAWTVEDTGYTVPVNINVTIEGRYALGWAIYAEEELADVTVSPTPEEMGPDDTEVTLTFENTGTADFLSYPEPIVYVGPVSEAYTGFAPRANATIGRIGDNAFNISGTDANANHEQQLAFYDESNDEWVIHSRENQPPRPPNNKNVGWINASELTDAIETGSDTTPRWEKADDPPQILDYDNRGSNADEYTFNSSHADTRICVVAYADNKIKKEEYDGVVEQLETCASNLENPEKYMPTELEINLTQDEYDSVVEESQSVEVEVENIGAVDSTTAHDVGLFVEDADGNVRVADYKTNESIGDIETDETKRLELNWTATSGDEETLYARVGVHDIDDANVSVEPRNTELNVEINDTETPGEVPRGSEVQVNATISNDGNAPVTDTPVTLLTEDGTPVDAVRIDRLESAGGSNKNETNVTLRWNAPVDDFDEELEVQALEANDTHTVTAAGTPAFEVDITDTDDVAAEGEQFGVNVSVENVGDGGGEQQLLLIADTETTDDLIVDSSELFVGKSDTETTALVWDSPVELQRGDNKVIVQSRDDTDSEAFDTEANFEVANINAPNEVDEDDLNETVSVTATIENTGDVAGTQTVELEPAADSALDIESSSSTTTIGGGDTETVTFDVTVREGSLTGELAVSTNNNEETERVVVVRDGPDCADVTYDDADSDGYLDIRTVDQLQCIEERGLGENYRLENDIDAYGTKHWNGGDGFEPIGANGSYGTRGDAFSATFDGQGHQIEGMTIERNDSRFIGLFAITANFASDTSAIGTGSTIENVELVDIYVRGETVVGGVAGGGGGTFRNISVSGRVESEYQQVGGIVGHAHDGDLTNQLVSTATVTGNEPIVVDDDDRHPWQETDGSPNLGIGGILGGMGYDTEFSVGYSRANVSGPSSVGGIAGWTSNNPSDLSQMYWADGTLSLEGDTRVFDETEREQFTFPLQPGGIAGRIGDPGGSGLDTIFNSVYSDGPTVGDGGDNVNDNSIDLDADEMKGPQVLPDDRPDSFYEEYPGVTREDAEGTMANLNWAIWEPVYDIDPETGEIINEGYPIFAWQAEGGFIVESVDTPDNVTEGESAVVEVQISNTQEAADEQRVVLRDPEGNPVNSTEIDLNGNEQETIELTWRTRPGDNTTGIGEPEITVSTKDSSGTDPLEVRTLQAPEFLIKSSSVSSAAVTELDDVVFTATIENDGVGGEQTVFLEDENGTILNSTSLDLGGEESEMIELTWETTFGDADPDDRKVALRTKSDAVSYDITVDEADGPNFQIESIDFPSDQGNSVAAGKALQLQVEITNQGGMTDTQYVSLMPAETDEILALETVTLADGATEEINLTWDPADDPTVDEIEVNTRDDSATESVIIRESRLDPTTNPVDIGGNIFDFV